MGNIHRKQTRVRTQSAPNIPNAREKSSPLLKPEIKSMIDISRTKSIPEDQTDEDLPIVEEFDPFSDDLPPVLCPPMTTVESLLVESSVSRKVSLYPSASGSTSMPKRNVSSADLDLDFPALPLLTSNSRPFSPKLALSPYSMTTSFSYPANSDAVTPEVDVVFHSESEEEFSTDSLSHHSDDSDTPVQTPTLQRGSGYLDRSTTAPRTFPWEIDDIDEESLIFDKSELMSPSHETKDEYLIPSEEEGLKKILGGRRCIDFLVDQKSKCRLAQFVCSCCEEVLQEPVVIVGCGHETCSNCWASHRKKFGSVCPVCDAEVFNGWVTPARRTTMYLKQNEFMVKCMIPECPERTLSISKIRNHHRKCYKRFCALTTASNWRDTITVKENPI